MSSSIRAEKQVVLSPHDHRAEFVFRCVIIDGQISVAGIFGERLPVSQAIAYHLAQG